MDSLLDEFPPLINLHNTSDLHKEIRASIVSFWFELTRKTSDDDLNILSNRLYAILLNIKGQLSCSICAVCYNPYFQYLDLLYKLIAYTRDIVLGKGERKLTYMMIYTWYKVYPILAIYAIEQLNMPIINLHNTSTFGCWKDIKYLCYYIAENSGPNDPLIETCIEIANRQLSKDIGCSVISTVSKWIPREHSQFGWLFEKMAMQWSQMFHPRLLLTPKTEPQYDAALCKAKMIYRRILSKLNADLGTVEVNQCARKIDAIIPSLVPIGANLRKKRVFSKHGHQFKQYYQDLLYDSSDTTPNKSKYPIYNYVKQALYYSSSSSSYDNIQILENRGLLNKQWNQMCKPVPLLDNFIPMVDMSDYMSQTSLYNALGLATLIASRSTGRILAVNQVPSWLNNNNIDDTDFIDKIQSLLSYCDATTANFIGAFELIIESIVKTNMSFAAISELTVVLLSDFGHIGDDFHSKITELFDVAGRNSVHKKPFPMVRIVYWNLSETITTVNLHLCERPYMVSHINEGMPKATRKDTCVLSGSLTVKLGGGHSLSGPSLSNLRYFDFMDNGRWKSFDSFHTILHMVHHPRYKSISELLIKIIE